MKAIIITRGTCGVKYTDANGCARYATKTAADGAFEIDDAQAKRLVSLGVASYVGAAATAPETTEEAEADLLPEDLDSLTTEQLKNLAGDLGVDITGCKKKADYIATLKAYAASVPDEDEDELPDLSAADPE